MEIMLVVLIIGILIAVAVPAYNNFAGKARTAACKENQRTLEGAILVYEADHSGIEPSAIADLSAYVDNAESFKCPSGGEYSIDGRDVTCSAGH